MASENNTVFQNIMLGTFKELKLTVCALSTDAHPYEDFFLT